MVEDSNYVGMFGSAHFPEGNIHSLTLVYSIKRKIQMIKNCLNNDY